RLAQFQIVCAIHFAHPAAAQQSSDPETPREQSARPESSFFRVFRDSRRAAEPAKSVGGGNLGLTGRADIRLQPRAARRAIEKTVALVLRGQHPFEFPDHFGVAFAGIDDKRLPILYGTFQGGLEDLS